MYYDKYLKYKTKYIELKNKRKQIGGGEKKLMLFKADWCGHCKAFMPTWNKLQNEMQTKIKFIKYDSEKDKNIIKDFGIKGFPTIIINNGKDNIEYVGSRDEESIVNFINGYLNN